jgi:hypothetical protein
MATREVVLSGAEEDLKPNGKAKTEFAKRNPVRPSRRQRAGSGRRQAERILKIQVATEGMAGAGCHAGRNAGKGMQGSRVQTVAG